MYVLLSVCLVLHPQRIDESLQAILREKPHAERIVRMQKGELQVSVCWYFLSSSHHLHWFNYIRNSKMHSLSLLRNFCLPSHLLSKHHLPIIAVNHFNSWLKFLWMKYNSNLLCQRFAGICLILDLNVRVLLTSIFCVVIYVCTLLCLSPKWLRFWKCPILISAPICYASNIRWRTSFGLKAPLDWTVNSNQALRWNIL